MKNTSQCRFKYLRCKQVVFKYMYLRFLIKIASSTYKTEKVCSWRYLQKNNQIWHILKFVIWSKLCIHVDNLSRPGNHQLQGSESYRVLSITATLAWWLGHIKLTFILHSTRCNWVWLKIGIHSPFRFF